MKFDYKARQDNLQNIPEADAVIIVPGSNMVYFTGLEFHLSERPIIAIFMDGQLSFIIPELEVPKLNARPDLEARYFMWGDSEGYMGAFLQAVNALDLRGKTLGVDGLTMRVTEMLAFLTIDPTLGIKPVERDLMRIRAHKTPEEVEAMRQAIQKSEKALDSLLAWVEPGMTEKQIAAKLSEELLNQGVHGLAFESLIQTGPNSALPHGMSNERELQRREFLLIDFGGHMDGYPADITRTFCLGTPSSEMQTIYDTVMMANQAAINAAKPGVPMGVVDKAARDVITAAGYGEYFIHRTGHGLGLGGHETTPQIAAGVTDVLEPGMTFTIEPGIYIPGMGGVRIEDNVLVTEDGLEVLTHYPKKLMLDR
jgi:Xaa-Pro dipeptidase